VEDAVYRTVVRDDSEEDIKSACVKQDVLDDYDAWTEEFFQRTVFVDGCRS
jgi:hypothetical protein